ncbi:MAG: NUDIX hydrolase [Xenococcus sp. MO_188.B8]|nr:NUDIX hydrolase [Xenococcus sp. MO_188.B8]
MAELNVKTPSSRVVGLFLGVNYVIKRLYYITKSVLRIIFRHPVTGTCIIPIFADGRIVLARRHDTGRWALPGGMVEWGEEIATTVRRELREETGLELVRISRLVGVYSHPDRDPRVHSICVVVEAEVQGEIQIQDEQEISEVEAFNPNDLPLVGLSYDNGKQLKNYLDGLTILA